MSDRQEKGWHTAHRFNVAAVAATCPSNGPFRDQDGNAVSGFKAFDARCKLGERRYYLDALKNINIDDIAALTCNTKADLLSATHAIIMRDTPIYTKKERDEISDAALLGTGDTLALMSMIAKNQALNPDPFDEEAYRLAVEKSYPTILFMTKLSHEADTALVVSIMEWSLEEMRGLTIEELTRGLEFDSAFFDFNEEDGSARLKELASIHPHIHDSSGIPFDFTSQPKEALFGCPFRSENKPLYNALSTVMIRNNIARNIFESAQAVNYQIQAIGKQALSITE